MSTRSRRRSTVQATESSIRSHKDRDLSTLDRLLLSQAVYETGTNSWTQVAKLLSRHPLVSRPKLFNAQNCRSFYYVLMEESGLEHDEECILPHASVHLQLAEAYYHPRINELRSSILEEEMKYKSISQEIEDIRSGKWDSKLRERMETAQASMASEHASRALAESSRKSREEAARAENQGESQAEPSTSQEPEKSTPAAESSRPRAQRGRLVKAEKIEEADVEIESHEGDTTDAEQFEDETVGSRPKSSSPANMEEGTPAPDNEDQDDKSEEETPTRPSKDGRATTRSSRGTVKRGRGSVAGSSRTLARGGKRAQSAEQDEAVLSEPISTRTREGKRRAPTDSADSPRELKRFREDSEPIAEDLAHGSKRRRGAGQLDVKTSAKKFQTVILMLHDQIFRHKNGTIFHNPIKHSEAPDYQDIVKSPMDLKTIKMKVKEGKITNSSEFSRDVYLMFANAMMYNRPGSDVYEMAKTMMQDSEQAIQTYRQTENFHISQS